MPGRPRSTRASGPWKPGPPFPRGNKLSVIHGANSPAAISARAAEVHAALLEAAPYLDDQKFLPAVNRYLEAAAREALLHGHIERTAAEKGTGAVPSRVWEQATAAARLAAKLGSDLGLDPIGHARIRALSVGAEVGEASLEELKAQGAATTGYKANAIESTTADGEAEALPVQHQLVDPDRRQDADHAGDGRMPDPHDGGDLDRPAEPSAELVDDLPAVSDRPEDRLSASSEESHDDGDLGEEAPTHEQRLPKP